MSEEKKEELIKKEEPVKKEEEPKINILEYLNDFKAPKKLLKRKTKRKKEKQFKSDAERALYEMRLEGKFDPGSIKNILTQFLPGNDKDINVQFFHQILASKFFNTNININDILGGRCFTYYGGVFGFVNNFRVFTCYNLYCIGQLYTLLEIE